MNEKQAYFYAFWEIESESFQQQYLSSKSIQLVLYNENQKNYKTFSKNLGKLILLENLEIKMIQSDIQYATYWLAQAMNQLTCLKSIHINIEDIDEDFEGMTFLKKSFQNLKQLEMLSLCFSKSNSYTMKQRYFDQLLKGISYLTNLKQLKLQFDDIKFDIKDLGKSVILDQLSQLTTFDFILEKDEFNTQIEQQIFRVIKSIQNILNASLIIKQQINDVEDLEKQQLKEEQEFLLIGDDHLDIYQQSFEQIPQQWNKIQNLNIQISQSIIRESSLNKFFGNINPNSINEINCTFKIASINTLKHIVALNNLKKLSFSTNLLFQTSSQEISINNSLEFLDLTFKPKGFVKSKDDFGAILQNLQNLKVCKLKVDHNPDQGHSIIKTISKSFQKLNDITELVLDDYLSSYSYLLEESLSLANGIGQLINLESLIVENGIFNDSYKFKQLIKNISKLNNLTRLKIKQTFKIHDNEIMSNLKQIKRFIKFDKFNEFYVLFENLHLNQYALIDLKKRYLFLSMIFTVHYEEELELTLSFIKILQHQRSLHIRLYLDENQEANSINNKEIYQSGQILHILTSFQMIKINELSISKSNFTLNKEFFLQFLKQFSKIQQLNKLSLRFKSLLPESKLRELIIKKLPKLVCIYHLIIEENLQFNNHILEESEEDLGDILDEEVEDFFGED